MIINKEKIINEIVRRLKNKIGIDTNHYEIRKLQNDIRSISGKLIRLTKKVEDIENAKYKKRKKSSKENDSKEKREKLQKVKEDRLQRKILKQRRNNENSIKRFK